MMKQKDNKEIKDNKKAKGENEPINWKREIIEWIIVAVSAFVFAGIIDNFMIINAYIPSASMETTIMAGDRIFGNRFSYKSSDPQRGDIVIFKYPDNESELFIKRVIGLPGETLEVRDGDVYINDSDTPLKETYIAERCIDDYGPITVPEGAYFMMGDNRNNSRDSRYWINHFVYRDKILGKAMFRFYPKIGKIPNTDPEY